MTFEARGQIAWATRPEILQAIEAAIDRVRAAGLGLDLHVFKQTIYW
jgi:hypothetical protein